MGPGERQEVASRPDPAAPGEMHNPGKSGPGTTPTSGARPGVSVAPRGLAGCRSAPFVWKTASSAGGQRASLETRTHTRFGSVCLTPLLLFLHCPLRGKKESYFQLSYVKGKQIARPLC